MRAKIKVDGKFYRPVPWLKAYECTGCVFDKKGCINNNDHGNPCDSENEFDGYIIIPATKVGLANYIALKLNHESENQLDN